MLNIAFAYPEVYSIAHFKTKRKEFPSFGVLYLASVIEKKKLGKVTLIKVDEETISLDFSLFDIVGFSLSSSVTYNKMKEVYTSSIFHHNTLKIIGGIHATIFKEAILLEMDAEVLCLGESEETVVEVVNQFQSRNFKNIKGIIYKKNGSIIKNPEKIFKGNIDNIPFPARHLLNTQDFIMTDRLSNTNLKISHIIASRGCAFSCKFCANLNKHVKYRSARNIKAELKMLKEKYKIDGFCITDDNFIINRKKVLEICKEINELELKWSALSRVDTVDEKVLSAMYNSGCVEVKFGVESGSRQLLVAMGKNITIKQITSAINIAKTVGLNVKIFLIHGFPGENMTTTNETIKLLDQLFPFVDRVSLFRFVPLPGSEVYNNPKKYKLNINAENKEKLFNQYHIYNNNYHWWGTKSDFIELEKSYNKIKKYILNKWKTY